MSCGAVVSAPAVVLSLVLDWNLTATALAITVPAVVYTMFGGVQAVTWTDVKIMVLVVFGLLALVVVAILGLPDQIGVTEGFSIAGTTGRMRTFDFSFDLTNQYTFWSGTIAAFFLFCSYFGTDQSQVQRYLTARSVDEARRSLLMSAYWKIPLQVLVLVLGVLVWVFYVFNTPPLIFKGVEHERMKVSQSAPAYMALEAEFQSAHDARRQAALDFAAADSSGNDGRIAAAETAMRASEAAIESVRSRTAALVRETTGDTRFSDVNYIIPSFILAELPTGLVGLLIVAIILAATDTIAGELNSLSTATVMDFYKRRVRADAPDAHYLLVSKIATGLWGLFACAVAVWAADLGSLIEVVNRFGSFFYGSILGVFILAIAVPRANGHGAFIGLIGGMGSVAWVASFTPLAFLWHNVVGAVAVVIVGTLVSWVTGGRPARTPASR
jgi:Na+/proline symporter